MARKKIQVTMDKQSFFALLWAAKIAKGKAFEMVQKYGPGTVLGDMAGRKLVDMDVLADCLVKCAVVVPQASCLVKDDNEIMARVSDIMEENDEDE